MWLNTWENDFFNQGVIERSTTIFDTFTWPTGSALEDYGVNEVLAVDEHFKKQLSLTNKNEDCMQAVHNEWYEFKVLGKGKKLNELLELALSNNERFPVLEQLLSIVCMLPASTMCYKRGLSLMNLVKNKFQYSMQEEALYDLMMRNMKGPSVKEFDPKKAVHQRYFSSKTTRHVHVHKRPNKEQWN
jgi:hypothetical protein